MYIFPISGDVPASLFLLQHGADANVPDIHNNTPLHLTVPAMNENMLKVAEMLIDRGARVDAQNRDLM